MMGFFGQLDYLMKTNIHCISGFGPSHTGFGWMARFLAVWAVLSAAAVARAQEYEVEGTIDLRLAHPDRSLSKDFKGNFRVYVSGCAWLIQVTETNDWGIPQRREVGTADGKEMYELLEPYEPLFPGDMITAGTNTGQIAVSGMLASNAVPGGQPGQFVHRPPVADVCIRLLFSRGAHANNAGL